MKKVKVTDIIISEEQKEALKLVTYVTRSTRNQERRKIIGFSDCICCGFTPAKLVTTTYFDSEGSICRHDTYCAACFKTRYKK